MRYKWQIVDDEKYPELASWGGLIIVFSVFYLLACSVVTITGPFTVEGSALWRSFPPWFVVTLAFASLHAEVRREYKAWRRERRVQKKQMG